MNTILKLSLTGILTFSITLLADEEIKFPKEANDFSEMFSDAKTSGQIRLGYGIEKTKEIGKENKSATAVGGQLKFETASLMGISFGAAMYTSHYISELSGKKNEEVEEQNKFYGEMASEKNSYTEFAEAYVNFSHEGFNFRGGRQLIDTPLAGSDDIRMTPHTFEAYIASYRLEDFGFSFMAGNILSWQGVNAKTDSGQSYANVIENAWQGTGENGTRMGAITYENDFIEVGAWYYDITKETKAFYVDTMGKIKINDVEIAIAAQYMNQKESDNSGTKGSLMGAMVEAGFYGATAKAAYNKVSKDDGKVIFEGFCGGSSFTNIDTLTAEELHADSEYGDGKSYMLGLGYEIDDFTIFSEYGDYKAKDIGNGKAHVAELNFGVEYKFGDAELIAIYAIGQDKEAIEKTEYDNQHFQVVMNYNF
ncbi:MAG: hypothetical protein RBR59_01215 [Sulfurimonadaceae bacterium]|jgi:hypothetical protein|nr:hypothetical protein [Sulfurimonadaceae bacterium]